MPPFTIYNSRGKALAGDNVLTPGLEEMADNVNGYILDDATGEQVYPVEETTDDEFGDAMPQEAKDIPTTIVES